MRVWKLAIVVLVLTRTAWSAEPNPYKTDGNVLVAKEAVLVPKETVLVAKGGNEFATDLYSSLRLTQTGNLFFSPYSISSALAMTYAGANGPTAAEMAKVLHFSLPEKELHPAFNSLRHLLVSNITSKGAKPGFQLRVANRLWGQRGFAFQDNFLSITKDNYGAEMGLLDFLKPEGARQTINKWVEEQTEDKIQELLKPGILDGNTRLVLTNAIYFKANWKDEFYKQATIDAPFHTSASEKITVPTMRHSARYRYADTNNVQLLELPYVGDRVSMVVLLPKKIDGLKDLEKQLTIANLQKWTDALQPRLVWAHLPKFKMTSEFRLESELMSLGMPLAFSLSSADFSRMTTQQQLFISAVVHKAFVDVNEVGTEAAAATAVVMSAGSGPGNFPSPIELRIDHPFVFVIRDNQTQSILFMGSVVNPKS